MKGLNSRGARGPTSTLSSFNPLIKIRALGILWRIINRCSFNRMIFFFPFIIYHLHGKACPAFSNIILCVRLHCICATGVIFDKQAETHVLLSFSMVILHRRGLHLESQLPPFLPQLCERSETDCCNFWKAPSSGKLCFQLRIMLSVGFAIPLLHRPDELDHILGARLMPGIIL